MLKELFLLDPKVIFLNHGSFGACPRPVFEEYQSWQRRLEQQPVQFLGVELDHYLLQARKRLGETIHAPASDIVFIPNATHGVNIVARSVLLKPGDEVLTTNHEYGACNYAWQFICDQKSAVYKTQPISLPVTSDDEIVDQLWQGVTPRTKLIFFSHITSPTAITLPVRQICERARQEGILTLVDGAHAPGQLPLVLGSLQPDFYVGNCHKWMLSPKGAGFIYTRPELQSMVEPLIVSWGYQSRYSPPRQSRYVDYLQWTGTHDPSAALSVPSAIDFMEAHKWDQVQNDCKVILKKSMEQISDISGLNPLYPLDSNYYHQMGTIPIPKMRDITELKSRLYDDYRIEIPCIEWESGHYLRISIQAYNSEEDTRALFSALPVLLKKLKVM